MILTFTSSAQKSATLFYVWSFVFLEEKSTQHISNPSPVAGDIPNAPGSSLSS